MKTFEDLLASVGKLSDSFASLASAVSARSSIDYGSIVAILDGITAQVQTLIAKLSPPAVTPPQTAAPVEPPATPPAA